MPIRVLPPELASQIAAGEVVERPASVVKELVENALDAGASRIAIEAQGGGLKLIRVSDNGSGIPAADAPLSFERHATSKIASSADLERIGTLGFRGEALASIASVADVQMLTRTADDLAGVAIHARAGQALSVTAQGAPVGTTVTVRRLFENVPARLKFLRSVTAEAGRIATVVGSYCLAYPEVQFSLLMDGRQSLATPGSGDLRDAVARVLGADVAKSMLEVPEGDGAVAVWGLVSAPSMYRSTRGQVHLFVNRRPVQSRALMFAVEEAYQGLLPEGKHPIAVLNLRAPLEAVDVNVHPAKAEVRFRDERAIFAEVQRPVRAVLVGQTPVPTAQRVPAPLAQPPRPGPSEVAGALTLFQPPSSPREHPSPTPAVPRPRSEGGLPVLRVLGQMASTYIVAEGPGGLYLIDQHAAHERITFDRLRQQLARRAVEVQSLLEPVVVELPPALDAVYQEVREPIQQSGFVLEPFGERSYLVRGTPAALGQADPRQTLIEALEYLGSRESRDYPWEERIALSYVCHHVVRAGRVLTPQEMEELVLKLEQTAVPHTCPHGRPTTIHLSQTQLEHEFGRR